MLSVPNSRILYQSVPQNNNSGYFINDLLILNSLYKRWDSKGNISNTRVPDKTGWMESAQRKISTRLYLLQWL